MGFATGCQPTTYQRVSESSLPTCFWEFHQPRSLKLKQSQSVMDRSSNQWNIGWKTVGSWRKYGNFTQMIRPTYPSSSNSPSCALDCWCSMFERYGPGSSTVLTRRIWLTLIDCVAILWGLIRQPAEPSMKKLTYIHIHIYISLNNFAVIHLFIFYFFIVYLFIDFLASGHPAGFLWAARFYRHQHHISPNTSSATSTSSRYALTAVPFQSPSDRRRNSIASSMDRSTTKTNSSSSSSKHQQQQQQQQQQQKEEEEQE